MHLLDSLLT